MKFFRRYKISKNYRKTLFFFKKRPLGSIVLESARFQNFYNFSNKKNFLSNKFFKTYHNYYLLVFFPIKFFLLLFFWKFIIIIIYFIFSNKNLLKILSYYIS